MKFRLSSTAYAWVVVVLLLAVWMLNYLDRQVIFTVFPLLQAEMHVSTLELGMLGTGFLWVYSLCSPWAGYAADRFGKKRLICLSLVAWSAITILSGCAKSFTEVAVLCSLMGVSEACYLPAGLALIASYHGPKTRSRAISLHYSGTYIGTVLGGGLGGWLAATYGWRSVFLLFGAIGTVYGLLLTTVLREPKTTASQIDTEVVPPEKVKLKEAASIILSTPGFWSLLVVFAIASICDWAIYTWMPMYLFESFHFSLAKAGFTATFYIKAGGFCGLFVGGMLADWWASRTPRGRVFTQCVGLLCAAPCLILCGATHAPLALYGAMIVFGLGKGMYDGNTMPVMCEGIPAHLRATAFGFLNFAGTFAGGAIAFTAGAMKSTIGLNGTFILCGALMVLGGVITGRLRMRPLQTAQV
jgi:MFS family permease